MSCLGGEEDTAKKIRGGFGVLPEVVCGGLGHECVRV
jgi:hypothetical protein